MCSTGLQSQPRKAMATTILPSCVVLPSFGFASVRKITKKLFIGKNSDDVAHFKSLVGTRVDDDLSSCSLCGLLSTHLFLGGGGQYFALPLDLSVLNCVNFYAHPLAKKFVSTCSYVLEV